VRNWRKGNTILFRRVLGEVARLGREESVDLGIRAAVVGELEVALVIEQHVEALDVTVHSTSVMQVFESFENLSRVLSQHRLVQTAALLEVLCER